MRKLFVLLLFLLTIPALADSRTWTDAKGSHHSTAELADFQGGIAYLRKEDGKIVAVPLVKFSKADQEFINSTFPAVRVIEGKVVGIIDGDTVKVVDGTTLTRIRLEGIDAPESHQAYGNKSKEALAAKVFQKNVRVEWRELDKYQRTLGQIFVDDRWINKEMVQEGWAWHYQQYSKSEVLANAESNARTAKAGLWADINPIPPWDFRHPNKPLPAVIASPTPANPPVETSLAPANTPKDTPTDRSSTINRNPYGEQPTGQTATGIPTYTGPRGGHYHYSQSGNKVYERRGKR